jgi:oxygen-independent coproporphyrinogen-3 oxidase
MKLILDKGLMKFDRQYPIYNFFYPSQRRNVIEGDLAQVLALANQKSKSRALYFHVPFCETICNFCPFTRGVVRNKELINIYARALIKEIELKSQKCDLHAIPIKAIFFGGGTPSLLSVEQILELGQIIKAKFDLSQLKEFSFEIEVKSLTLEKALALKQIGVTHPRFGLQTFNQSWRDMFDLTASLEQIHSAANILTQHFDFTSFDILYGMNGQDESQIIEDLDKAISLETKCIDIYPIDNIMTQVKLHKKTKEAGYQPTSATRKFSMNILIDQYMRSRGFCPHNGHGYHRTPHDNKIVTDQYSFVYHEHVYGYHDYDLISFGVNAISSTFGHTITNVASRHTYLEEIAKGNIPCSISQHSNDLDYSKPIVLRLPYHGEIDKNLVNWNDINQETLNKFNQLVGADLIRETPNNFEITKLGWYWYVNMMYYLMPRQDQLVMNNIVVEKLKHKGREFTREQILFNEVKNG